MCTVWERHTRKQYISKACWMFAYSVPASALSLLAISCTVHSQVEIPGGQRMSGLQLGPDYCRWSTYKGSGQRNRRWSRKDWDKSKGADADRTFCHITLRIPNFPASPNKLRTRVKISLKATSVSDMARPGWTRGDETENIKTWHAVTTCIYPHQANMNVAVISKEGRSEA